MKIIFFSTMLLLLFTGCTSNTSGKSDNAVAESNVASMTDLTSVTSVNILLCQNWENKEDAEQAQNSDGSGDLEMPYRSFSFFPDSTVVKNPREEMQYGHWILNDADKTIVLKYDNGKSEKYKIKAINAKNMTLTKYGDDNTDLLFVADGKQEKDYKADPFYSTNNGWRIKPESAETDAAIKERLRGNIRFYWLFLQDNLNRNSSTISFYGLPSCFNWYTGGITIVNEKKLKANWINTFYNHEEAMKAHAMMEHLIIKNYVWDTTQKNWLKQTSPILLQMQDSLK